MNPFKSRLFVTCSLFLALSVAGASLAEARFGGGRSSGFRGSRGFGRSAAPASPYRYQGSAPQQPAQPMGAPPVSPGAGSFGRGLMGGLAGGMIGSMLFRNSGFAGTPGGMGGGGFGMLELMLLAGLGYMAYRYFAARRLSTAGPHREVNHYERLASVEPGPFAQAGTARGESEQDLASTLSRHNQRFDLSTFKEERMDHFVRFQAAWNLRDISSLSDFIAPEFRAQVDADITQLKNAGRINRIENIAVRNTELVEAWQESGQEFATLRFKASLLDYTLDEASGQVVAGDKSQPVKFEESWTFVRSVSDAGSSNSWKLTAIEV